METVISLKVTTLYQYAWWLDPASQSFICLHQQREKINKLKNSNSDKSNTVKVHSESYQWLQRSVWFDFPLTIELAYSPHQLVMAPPIKIQHGLWGGDVGRNLNFTSCMLNHFKCCIFRISSTCYTTPCLLFFNRDSRSNMELWV